MKLKSFFAGSVEEALSEARREFGPEAVLVQSRRTAVEAGSKCEYEVVCALLPEDEVRAADDLREQRPARDFAVDARKLADEIAELKRCLQRIQSAVVLASANAAATGTPVQVREALSLLLAAEVDPDLAQQIIGEAGAHTAGQGSGDDFVAGRGTPLTTLVHRHVMRLAACRPTLGAEAARSRAVALVGPPGAGKTTCVAKLATRQAITMHRKAHVLALDEFRVGGSEQLRAYAAIIGVGFDALAHDSSLGRALEERKNEQVLIDVPGYSRFEMDLAERTARDLRALDVEVQLVLPVSLRSSDLRRISEDFAVFRPEALIFTRLDETRTFGPLLNEIVRTGRPASFLSGGPRVPEDIEPATRVRIADLVVPRIEVGRTLRAPAQEEP
ncbi:MAG TPA: hypothetical protein VMJ34_01760 [Bryobacteraceae bacterium]|nr:hypothetical protein [Bryobacteraceae bacterium]